MRYIMTELTLPKTLWTTYNGFKDQEKTIYTSNFDGTRPFVMQEKSVDDNYK
jgi:hypothetical protein